MYSIKDLTLITGLTERTLRNYLKLGILVGKKNNGVWQFSEEEISAFLKSDYVKASININRNSIVLDCLKSKPNENTACIILHLPKENSRKVAAFFCEAVNKRNGLKMTFDVQGGTNKVILTGGEDTVYDVLREYHNSKS